MGRRGHIALVIGASQGAAVGGWSAFAAYAARRCCITPPPVEAATCNARAGKRISGQDQYAAQIISERVLETTRYTV
jgi:hypothetical protein